MHRLSDPLAVNWASRAGGASSKLEGVPKLPPVYTPRTACEERIVEMLQLSSIRRTPLCKEAAGGDTTLVL